MSNIVLVGVGGAGISSYATLFYELGYKNIIGIDAVENEITRKLASKGIPITIGHGKYQVMPDDVVIYSDVESIKNGPEVKQAFAYAEERVQKASTVTPKSNFPFPYTYNEFLGEISKRFTTLAIAGSKGKSTTTAMMMYAINQVEKEKQLSSSILKIPFGLGIVGALVPDFENKNVLINENYKNDLKAIFDRILWGKGVIDYSVVKKYLFVVEACEYKEHFLLLDVDYAVITNTYREHKDYFKTPKSYREAYRKLIEKTRYASIMLEQEGKKMLKEKPLQGSIQKKLVFTKPSSFHFSYIFGTHNNLAASLVVKTLELLVCMQGEKKGEKKQDIPTLWEKAKKTIFANFHGVWRRMELLGKTRNGALVYSDYAHTPESIKTCLKAFHEHYSSKHILCIFQPHQALRLLAGRTSFRNALKLAHRIIIYKLYTARENLSDSIAFLHSHSRLKKQVGTLLSEKGGKLQNSKKQWIENIKSFDDIGQLFALSCAGQYVKDIATLRRSISTAKENTIVIVFTAGDLDYALRKDIVNL